jgi:Endonuclease/Exonuclease/phosphatase family
MITRARTLSINCRNKTAMADIPFPSRHWNRRLPVLIKFINNCAPSVIGVQETRDDMAVDITNGLGPNWTFWGSGTAKIIWDTRKWIVVDQFEAGLPYTVLGMAKARPLTMLKLQSIKTQGFTWFASTHLSVNIPNEEAIRQKQIKLVIQHVEERPDHERVIIFGDFNSIPTNASVRKIASDATGTYAPSCRQSPAKRATHSTAGRSLSERASGSMTS